MDMAVDILDISTIIAYTTAQILLTDNQLYNADVNHDSYVDILDVVMLVDCILNVNCDQLTRNIASGTAAGTLNIDQSHYLARSDEVNVISIDSEIPVRGLQMDVQYEPEEYEFSLIEQLDAASGLILEYNDDIPGLVKVVLYPEDMFEIPAGAQDILQLEFTGLERSTDGSMNLSLANTIVSGPNGIKIIMNESSHVAGEFRLHPAYPNPFNPVTPFSCTHLPVPTNREV